jgi:hypothetical protein
MYLFGPSGWQAVLLIQTNFILAGFTHVSMVGWELGGL